MKTPSNEVMRTLPRQGVFPSKNKSSSAEDEANNGDHITVFALTFGQTLPQELFITLTLYVAQQTIGDDSTCFDVQHLTAGKFSTHHNPKLTGQSLIRSTANAKLCVIHNNKHLSKTLRDRSAPGPRSLMIDTQPLHFLFSIQSNTQGPTD
ncbi:hypothetical protein DNTS_009495 [Danionella cerebrum]|uniref:Uncharacterized protein n=1 Tax=Danionella cerebrum TaxID=2873325 RepID=A0A553P573_9TELE|nr:hypothetical protein DNTS_009495 [Danionella translucida]